MKKNGVRWRAGVAVLGAILVFCGARLASGEKKVTLARTPGGGIQPRGVMDAQGTLHLIYFQGDVRSGDIFYVRRNPRSREFTAPLRVNSQAGSALAIGTVRGPQIAVGRNGRVHVAWMGSETAAPRGPAGSTPLLYARLNDAGAAFEAQRNVARFAGGLDGGLSVAADPLGDVDVVWHGLGEREGEDNRRVWIAQSSDDGRTFARERAATSEATGACGCCGMAAWAGDAGGLSILYRAATEKVHRDMILLAGSKQDEDLRARRLSQWTLKMCPMSTAALTPAGDSLLAAWEKAGQVYYSEVGASASADTFPISPPGDPENRKHPVLARNAAGETALVWTEGTGWGKGGAVAWQVFDPAGRPTAVRGRVDGLPAWSLASVVAESDGTFLILY